MKQIAFAALVVLGQLVVPSKAVAQATPHRVVFDVNFGMQTASQSLESETSNTVFGETATIAIAQEYGSNPMMDARLGYRLSPHVAVALVASAFRSTSPAAVAAIVPSQVIFGNPSTVNVEAPEMKRVELGYHLQVAYVRPITDKIELQLFAGPSLTYLRQYVVTSLVATGAGTPSVVTENQSGRSFGGHAGFDATYGFSPHVGAGVFLRYSFGSVDLSSVSDINVGGIQTGAGIRLRF